MSGIGLAFLIATPALYALNATLLKRGTQTIPPFAAMTVSMAILFALSLVLSLTTEKSFSWSISENRDQFAVLVAVGFVNTLAFWALLNAFRYSTMWQQQLFTLLAPIFAAVFALFILGEEISPKLFVSVGFMGIGLYIAVR